MAFFDYLRGRHHIEHRHTLVEIQLGDSVICEDGYVGSVRTIGLSPYYEEEQAGIIRVYIVGEDGLGDWVLPHEQIGNRAYASVDGIIIN